MEGLAQVPPDQQALDARVMTSWSAAGAMAMRTAAAASRPPLSAAVIRNEFSIRNDGNPFGYSL